MKALIIVNPHAHSGEINRQTQREQITQRLQTLAHVSSVEWVETQHSHHGTRLAQEATQNGYRYILAAGGDGTISEVLNGVMSVNMETSARPIFGVLPWGTLNDFHTALKTAESAHGTATPDQITQPLDIGRVVIRKKGDSATVERFACLSISIGLSSWANQHYMEASRRFGRRLAHIPGALNAIRTYRPSPGVTVTLDNQPPEFKQMLSIAINNCASVGGGVQLTPDAKVDDGQFDLCIIAPVPLWRVALLLMMARLGVVYHDSAVQLGRAHDIVITSTRSFSIHIDGESVPKVKSKTKQVSIHVMPAELQVIAPSVLGF
ncbi:MAG: diacylglycerol kinase family protein [Chloroflexota bacterium]